MLTMPTYTLNGKKIVKWEDVEVILSHIKEEMQRINTHGAKEFEKRFRDGWHDSKVVFEAKDEVNHIRG